MKMRYVGISVLVVLFMSRITNAQEATHFPTAKEQINELKGGTLLIKLNTQSQRIEHRIKTGQKERAQELIDQVEKEHAAIIASFKNFYLFSDYYFFLSDESDAVLLKKDYKSLFKVKNQNIKPQKLVDQPYVLILGVPPGYSTVDKYKFILYSSDADGIKSVVKPMPKVFKTQSKKLFSNSYDFKRSVQKMQDRLFEFYQKMNLIE